MTRQNEIMLEMIKHLAGALLEISQQAEQGQSNLAIAATANEALKVWFDQVDAAGTIPDGAA